MASGVFNISVFVSLEFGALPFSDQNGSWNSHPYSFCLVLIARQFD